MKPAELKMEAIRLSSFYTQVLRGVDLVVDAGERHVIVGPKGCGKSALAGILQGAVPMGEYSGTVLINDLQLKCMNPSDAMSAGVTSVPQQAMLVEELTVCDNVALGLESGNLGVFNPIAIHQKVEHALRLIGADKRLSPAMRVYDLDPEQRQLVSIARAVYRPSGLLVLDDPSECLGTDETQRLILTVADLNESGATVLCLTSDLKLSLKIADRISILKDGKIDSTHNASDLSYNDLFDRVAGRTINRTGTLDQFCTKHAISDREKDVIRLLIRGYTNKDVSEQLNISVNTVKSHIAKIYQKLGVENRVELMNEVMGDVL